MSTDANKPILIIQATSFRDGVTEILIKSHTCSLEYNKKLWSPPQMILVTVYCFDSNKERKEKPHVSWPTFNNS